MVIRFTVMEKKLTNSGPFMASTSKHSIYPSRWLEPYWGISTRRRWRGIFTWYMIRCRRRQSGLAKHYCRSW